MPQGKVRALRVQLDIAEASVVLVGARGIRLYDMNLMAKALADSTGFRVGVTEARPDDLSYVVPVAMIRFAGASPSAVESAMRKLKEMVTLQLPVAIGGMEIGLWLCRCNYLSSRHKDIQFVVGFEPDDQEAFMLRYLAAMKRLPVAGLFSEEPRPPYSKLMDAVEELLAGLGAFATEIRITPEPDPRPCSHR